MLLYKKVGGLLTNLLEHFRLWKIVTPVYHEKKSTGHLQDAVVVDATVAE